MTQIQQPRRKIEVRKGSFSCRLKPLPQGKGYEVFLFHYRPPRGYINSRLIFQVEDPREIVVLLELMQEVIYSALAAEE